MADPVIRPDNAVLMITLQTGESFIATPNPLVDAIACDIDSVSYNGPYKSEQSNESNGSFSPPAPLVTGQPSTFSFRARLRGLGPGSTYSATVKPPLHAALSACGFLGQFTPGADATAITSGTGITATLPAAFFATTQYYRGQPFVMSGSPVVGRRALVMDYVGSTRIATFCDQFTASLTSANSVAVPPNWTYAPTSPANLAARATMHPCASINWVEDGRLKTWYDCRGTVDFEGDAGKPGYAVFNFTGIYAGDADTTVPDVSTVVTASAPLLVSGAAGTQPVFQIARRAMAISKWSLKNSGQIETPDDPNTALGFGAGHIAGRTYMLETDPLLTQVATRNAITDIANYTRYPAGIQMGLQSGNSVSLTLPTIQPVETSPGMRGKLRSETLRYQAISPSKDSAGRDGDIVLCFS